jgi:sugar phosphate isomerase/epimerase
MFRISAFADEIDPDPVKQVDALASAGVRHVELRSILKTNVLDLSADQVRDLKALFDRRGITLSAIGSPIGKIKITDPFEPHLKRFQRAVELCKIFGTNNIRVFSYYPPEGGAWDDNGDYRREVLDRCWRCGEIAVKAGVRLLHENEHRIYGDDPARVVDLMETLREQPAGECFSAVYDPANYVYCGFDPWDGWQRTKKWTTHLHIKDWIKGQEHGSLAGEGQGRIPEVLAEANKAGYDGFATLEPHLLGGGPTGGVTGPELFPKAVAALKKLLDNIGASYQ